MVDAGSSHTAVSFWEWSSCTEDRFRHQLLQGATVFGQDDDDARHSRCTTTPKGTVEESWMGGIGDKAHREIEKVVGGNRAAHNNAGDSDTASSLDASSAAAITAAVRHYMEARRTRPTRIYTQNSLEGTAEAHHLAQNKPPGCETGAA